MPGQAEPAAALSPQGHAARQHAEENWPVFPCVPRDKPPLARKGFHAASTDGNQIRQWWTNHPDANIGLALPVGVVVVDIDDPEAKQRLKGEDRDLLV